VVKFRFFFFFHAGSEGALIPTRLREIYGLEWWTDNLVYILPHLVIPHNLYQSHPNPKDAEWKSNLKPGTENHCCWGLAKQETDNGGFIKKTEHIFVSILTKRNGRMAGLGFCFLFSKFMIKCLFKHCLTRYEFLSLSSVTSSKYRVIFPNYTTIIPFDIIYWWSLYSPPYPETLTASLKTT
jgi:hypothetical protein